MAQLIPERSRGQTNARKTVANNTFADLGADVASHGCSVTLTAPRCFFWKIC
jgi:hypothetical protein